jgi:hypothetical protein
MFGYINVCKEELKVKDYELFRAYYCGVCKALGKHYSHISRLGLSYDIVFLAILLSAVSEAKLCAVRKSCFVHPTKKRTVIVNSDAVEYAASAGIILSYLKLWDDWADDKSIKSCLAAMSLYFPFKKARKKYKAMYGHVKKYLDILSGLEKENCSEIDRVSDAFASLLQNITAEFSIPQKEERQVGWLLYNIGKWIYMIDAFDDLEKDFKRGGYNPYLSGYDPKTQSIGEYKSMLQEKLDLVFGLTLQNIAQSYELLTVYSCDEILRNIIYLGLNQKTHKIVGGNI